MNEAKQSILILDFGGQYTQLIARRVREHNVFCEIKSHKMTADEVAEKRYTGIILSGGPNSAYVYSENSPKCDPKILELGVPVLGICYGAQIIAEISGGSGSVKVSENPEYGNTTVNIFKSPLFNEVADSTVCWMSHTDFIEKIPKGFEVIAKTSSCPVAAMANNEKKLYALQFHPEVNHTVEGNQIIRNFLYGICGATGDWTMDRYSDEYITALREKVGNKKVLLALSGGVDSSVCAVLVHKAIGKQLTCVFVDHGLMRKNEAKEVEQIFVGQYDINLISVDASERFLGKLSGVTDPETKRKIIGEEFIRVFEDESKKLGNMEFLCQGTIYPDIIESGVGDSAVIKSHHNVGGLPENIGFEGLIEPLRDLFKDEVRKLGTELGIPDKLVWRQPFPGPGLAVRCIGEINKEKLNTLREADAIFREEVANADWDRKISQYFAILTNVQSVGVMGDNRTYNNTIALRGVNTTDFMTADWTQIPYEILAKVSSRIVNEVPNVNRVVYDITSKPPATIEWE